MAVKRTYRINLRNYGNGPAIMVSQYDENYDLVFEVFDGVVPATGLNAYTVKLVGRQPGEDPALKYEFTGTVSGMANNILSFTIDTTMTGRAGKGTAEIVILDTTNDVKFASFNLPVYVEKAAVPDDAIDADVERAQEIAEQVQEIVDTAKEEVEAGLVDVQADIDDLEDRVEALEQGSGGSGLTEAVKVALLQIAQNVAYIDADGQDYYDDLYDALYPPASLVSISAVYSGGPVPEGTSLNALKTDLTVTAHFDDQTTQTVTTYTLSGTLTVGTSTITVSYGGKTDTFTVTVTQAVTEELWINDLGNTGSTASFAFAPFVYPSDVYTYDYTKQITAIEGDFTNSGSITVGYYSGDITQGVAYDSSKFEVHEVLSVSATGVNKLELTEPLQIPSDAVLAIGQQSNDGATFKYGGTKTKGFVYKDTVGGGRTWKDQNKTLGLNIYRI